MRSSTAQRLSAWAAQWARRRQGADPLGVTLERRRIYILPTRFGIVFGGLVFAMLLGSLNYGASLGFVLTFLLGGLLLVVMHHTHNNLLGVRLRFAGAPPVFAGEAATFRIVVANDSAAPRYEIALRRAGSTTAPVDIAPQGSALLQVSAPTQRRGWVALERFGVLTRYPGTLFKAWAWVHMDARALVYPAPAPRGRPLPSAGDEAGRTGSKAHEDADFAGLRTAVAGDPPQRIAWKAYARSDVLLLKQFASGDARPAVLDWDALPDLDIEGRLAQLARWCLDAHENNRAFGLRLPGTAISLGSGEPHLAECLRALALFEANP